MIKQNFKCHDCGETFTLEIELADFKRWLGGEKAQNAFPYLSADERELIISGTCGKCFDALFDRSEEIQDDEPAF